MSTEKSNVSTPSAPHCYADRLVDLIDGHLPLDDDEREIIRRCALEVFSGPLEFFFDQMQMQTSQIDGQNSYHFRSSGWHS